MLGLTSIKRHAPTDDPAGGGKRGELVRYGTSRDARRISGTIHSREKELALDGNEYSDSQYSLHTVVNVSVVACVLVTNTQEFREFDLFNSRKKPVIFSYDPNI